MRNNIKKSIIVLSCLFACILPSNIFAVEDKNLEKITDFLSTCQIKSQYISISEPVPTYKDKKLFNNDMNYIVLTGNHIAGILTDTNGIFTYMDLSDKSIGNYIVTTVYAIEYRDIDILIYIDNIAYSVSKDEINTTTDFKKTTTKFNTEKISLLQTRSSSKYLSIPKYKQDTNYTCWATCIASVAKYKGRPYTAPSAISRAHGIDPNKRGATIGETQLAMSSQFRIKSTIISKGPHSMDIINLINADKPLITGFKSPQKGHMCVIRGYAEGSSYFTVSYLDPSSATYKTSQVTTDRNIQFKVGNITYTSATYLKLL